MANLGLHLPTPTIAANQVQQKPEALWSQAVKLLKDEDQKLIDFQRPDKIVILDDVLACAAQRRKECIEKRWKIKRKSGEVIVLRDVFESIIKWANNFKAVGDVAVQFDPTHASLPWAGVRLLLQWATNDSQIFGAMIEGLETVASLISRYSLFEAVYLRIKSPTTDRLRNSIVVLYAAILVFLGKALRYYSKSAGSRFAKSLVQINDTTLDDLMQDVRSREKEAERDAQLVLMELQQNTSDVVGDIHQDNTDILSALSGIQSDLSTFESSNYDQLRRLRDLISKLERPIITITNQVTNYQSGMDRAERLRVLDWLSQVPYPQHHENVRMDRLASSGSWMIGKPQFRQWADSTSSSMLWLHGIPGSGKTKLASVVIDGCLQQVSTGATMGLAYFYCARNPTEPLRADPLEILRSIARQLSCPNLNAPIQPATMEVYEKERDVGFSFRRLDLRGVVDLILKLTAYNPSTIVLDALDECDSSRRHELFDALDNILRKSSNLVKIFVTSRDDTDVVCRLGDSPNIYINAADNAEDIQRFIDVEIENAINQKRLLRGKISSSLRDTLTTTLNNGAQGMFRWVSLQLQNLCNPNRMKVESDVRTELQKLPITLSDLYKVIFDEIQESGPYSRRIGMRVLKWALGAVMLLSTTDFIAMISSYEDGYEDKITAQTVLDITRNLLVKDQTLFNFTFAHLSVREYLETVFTPQDIDLELGLGCLGICFPEIMSRPKVSPGAIPESYAAYHWQHHCSGLSFVSRRRHLPFLPSMFFTASGTVSPAFTRWKNSLYNRPRQDASLDTDPFIIVCKNGFSEVVDAMSPATAQRLNQQLFENDPFFGEVYNGMNGLHLAAYYNRILVVIALLEKGVDVETPNRKGKTALHIAAEAGHSGVIKTLISYGANLHATTTNYPTHSISASAVGPHRRPASSLGFRTSGGGNESILEEDSEAAIHFAASSGSKEVVQLMLEHGADINSRSSQGSTPLHKALEAGQEDIIELLTDAGADVNSPLLYGRTPLHFTAALGQEKVAESLLRKGADRTKRDVFGSYPFEVAKRYGYEAMADMLKPPQSYLESLNENDNWLLQFDQRESNSSQMQSIPEIAVTEWKTLPIRNHMLEELSRKREQELRLSRTTSHLFKPEASLPGGKGKDSDWRLSV
ncbi:hypothetical protein FQN54_008166 [Arachnomyces sp. PD_36]|nr:hypothetical protein FQN54_008166 [Arachnomyces sp. PD_36]